MSEKPRSRAEAMAILEGARKKVHEILETSSPETGLEVVVVMGVKCDGDATEIDVFTSTHCQKCALYHLSEAAAMVEKDDGNKDAPN